MPHKCYHPWTLKFSKTFLRIIWTLNLTGHHNRKQHAPLSTDTPLALSLVLSAPIFFIQSCLGRMSLIYGSYVVLFYSFWENRSTSGQLPSTQHFILPLTLFFFLSHTHSHSNEFTRGNLEFCVFPKDTSRDGVYEPGITPLTIWLIDHLLHFLYSSSPVSNKNVAGTILLVTRSSCSQTVPAFFTVLL